MRQAPGELMAANPYKKREPNIREQVYGMLRQDIALGKIGFDVRLVDNEIAASLNVSRMPVREALLQLKNEGVLEGTSRGFVLRVYTAQDIEDIFSVRLLLEPPAAKLACVNQSRVGMLAMEQSLSRIEATLQQGDPIDNIQANWAFPVRPTTRRQKPAWPALRAASAESLRLEEYESIHVRPASSMQV